jgi:predicted kinase
MKKIIITRGLPASGKTTFARELMAKDQMYKRINRDSLREMIDNGQWSGSKEKYIKRAEIVLTELYLEDGFNVIVDDCNLSDTAETIWGNIAKQFGAEFEVKDFRSVPLDECLKRDQKRTNYVGEKVIRQMYRQFLEPKPLKIEVNQDLPWTIICDLDGTLALFGDANPYDRDFSKDEINVTIKNILHRYIGNNCRIIIVSGRDGKYEKVTREWLDHYDVPYDDLFMRTADDKRKDVIIKQEIYDANIKGKYNVLFVLDDRDQVVELWRSLGLTCLQVNFGNF